MASQRTRAASTRALLLQRAVEVFQQRGYHGASVAEICRRSNLANGTFYRYFPNKAALFLALAQEMAQRLVARVDEAAGAAADAAAFVRAYLATFLEFVAANRAHFQIFRETEFVDKRASLAFYDALSTALARGLRVQADGPAHDGADLVTADFLIGVPLLWAINRAIWEGRPAVGTKAGEAVETLTTFALDGLGGRPLGEAGPLELADRALELLASGASRRHTVRPVSALHSRGGVTRRRLLRAAEAVVGRRGFFETGVADITRRARVGLGTFYLHFRSKQDMLRALVEAINEALRQHVLERAIRLAGPGADRRLVEAMGLLAFFEFIERHRDVYRVVREAEFADEPVARWYYRRIAEPYARALAESMARGEIRKGDPVALAYAIMGVGHFIGVRWIVWKENRPGLSKPVLKRLLELVLGGVRPVVGRGA